MFFLIFFLLLVRYFSFILYVYLGCAFCAFNKLRLLTKKNLAVRIVILTCRGSCWFKKDTWNIAWIRVQICLWSLLKCLIFLLVYFSFAFCFLLFSFFILCVCVCWLCVCWDAAFTLTYIWFKSNVEFYLVLTLALLQALDTFNATVVSPIYYAMFTSFTILASAIMFKVSSCRNVHTVHNRSAIF